MTTDRIYRNKDTQNHLLGRCSAMMMARYSIFGSYWASDIGRYKLNRICFTDKFASYLPAGFMDRASFAYEAIAIMEGRLTMMNRDFSRAEVDEIIAYLVT